MPFSDEIDAGDTAWMLVTTTFVMLQTPALGICQAGMIRRKNSLSVMMQTLTGLVIGSVMWFAFGFSLVFGKSCGGFIGDITQYPFYTDVIADGSLKYAKTIPAVLFATFQMMFALMVPVIITGAWAEKFSFKAFLMFVIIWPVIVYYPVAHWVWGDGGWLAERGVLDFAGGLTIHTCSGFAALVVSLVLKPRHCFYKEELQDQHHNIPLTVVGGSLIWAGWYSFNGGSAYAANSVAASALINTHISSCTAASLWVLIAYTQDHYFHLTEILSGAFAGLAGVTPGSGFVTPQAAFIIGIITGLASYYSVRFLRDRVQLDDVLDVSSLQGAPGFIGSLAVGICASKTINPDAVETEGVVYGSAGWELFGNQLLAGVCIIAWTVVITFLLLILIDKTVGLHISEEDAERGLDAAHHGETAYIALDDNELSVGSLCRAVTANDIEELKRLYRLGAILYETDYDGRTAIHVAAGEGRAAILKFMCEHLEDVNMTDRFGCSPLHDAVRGRHEECIKILIEAGGALKDNNSGEMLCRAAQTGDNREVKLLLMAKCDPAAADYDGRTALHLAAAEGHIHIAKLLVPVLDDLNIKDRFGTTPLQDAMEMVDNPVVQYLIDNGANAEDPQILAHDFLHACSDGDLDTVKRMVNKQFDVNRSDYDGRTGLHLAAAEGRMDVLNYLIKQRANVNAVDRFGTTPLADAIRDNRVDAAKALKDAGAQVEDKQEAPRKPTTHEMIDTCHRGDLPRLKQMVKLGGSVTGSDYDGRTCLHLACTSGSIPLVQYLLAQKGVDINVQDNFKGVPLQDALRTHNKGIVAYLVENGAKLPKDRIVETLVTAAAQDDVWVLSSLSRTGVDFNRGDYDGRTPLHLAASEGRQKVVEFLLTLPHVSVNPEDRFGGTPLKDAIRHGHTEIAKILQGAGGKLEGSDNKKEEQIYTMPPFQSNRGRADYMPINNSDDGSVTWDSLPRQNVGVTPVNPRHRK